MVRSLAFASMVVGLVPKSCPTLATPWTAACKAPPEMEFSRQEYWSGLLFPSSGDLPDPGSEPGLLHCRKILYQLSYWGSPMLPMKSDRYIFCFSLLSAESALSLSFTVKSLAPPSASLNWWSKLLTPLLLKPQFPMKVFI